MNRGSFNTADWSTVKVEYPTADFKALATSEKTTDTKVTVVNMAASTNYEVRVIAHSDCETINAATVKVVAGKGQVVVMNAAGKKVVVNNVLGQTIANTVMTSDNVTIAAPQGVVVVAVEGEKAVKAIVK